MRPEKIPFFFALVFFSMSLGCLGTAAAMHLHLAKISPGQQIMQAMVLVGSGFVFTFLGIIIRRR